MVIFQFVILVYQRIYIYIYIVQLVTFLLVNKTYPTINIHMSIPSEIRNSAGKPMDFHSGRACRWSPAGGGNLPTCRSGQML